MAYFKKVHPLLQLLIFGGMAMGCFMIFGFIGTFVLAKAAGIDLMTLSDPDKWDYANPSLLTFSERDAGRAIFCVIHYSCISFCTIL